MFDIREDHIQPGTLLKDAQALHTGSKGAVFDLDGLLIDSEPHWWWAQAITLEEAGAMVTESRMIETTDPGLEAAFILWREWLPEAPLEKKAIGDRLQELMGERIAKEGKAKLGVHHTIEICRKAGCRLAVTSSSGTLFIRIALRRLGVLEYFHVLVSSQEMQQGKPHPAVYMAVAKRLGLLPGECLAFEDSIHGLQSAKSAGMRCVAVPEGMGASGAGSGIANIVLPSLDSFTLHMLTA
ncbi:MAG: HAD family phosphatase [Fibrobacterota bacterium]|nr:HAD family phosphatase [Fibrobacterota bacterium]